MPLSCDRHAFRKLRSLVTDRAVSSVATGDRALDRLGVGDGDTDAALKHADRNKSTDRVASDSALAIAADMRTKAAGYPPLRRSYQAVARFKRAA